MAGRLHGGPEEPSLAGHGGGCRYLPGARRTAGFPEASIAKGRQTYLTALFRARSEGSVEGVLRTAERFAELGDRGVVEQCIRAARQVAASSRDPQTEEYVRAFTECWAADAQGSTTGG